MNPITRELFSFIEKSPTSFHAVENARQALDEAGFKPLLESRPWSLTPGQGYYVVRNQSSLIAFRLPETITGFMVGAAHTDSPCLKLKENMELHLEGYTKTRTWKSTAVRWSILGWIGPSAWPVG